MEIMPFRIQMGFWRTWLEKINTAHNLLTFQSATLNLFNVFHLQPGTTTYTRKMLSQRPYFIHNDTETITKGQKWHKESWQEQSRESILASVVSKACLAAGEKARCPRGVAVTGIISLRRRQTHSWERCLHHRDLDFSFEVQLLRSVVSHYKEQFSKSAFKFDSKKTNRPSNVKLLE